MSDNTSTGEMHERPRRLKRVVIKEELVALTGGHIKSLILNQFLYWSERVEDYDEFIKEEMVRDPEASIDLSSGWVYKKAEQLLEELMLNISIHTLRRRVDELVESGWLIRRRNPKYSWDKTLQYRPDILKLQRDLQALGFPLDDYPLLIAPDVGDGCAEASATADSSGILSARAKGTGSAEASASAREGDVNVSSSAQKGNVQVGEFPRTHHEFSKTHGEFSSDHHEFSKTHHERSNAHGERAIPETTTEITDPEITNPVVDVDQGISKVGASRVRSVEASADLTARADQEASLSEAAQGVAGNKFDVSQALADAQQATTDQLYDFGESTLRLGCWQSGSMLGLEQEWMPDWMDFLLALNEMQLVNAFCWLWHYQSLDFQQVEKINSLPAVLRTNWGLEVEKRRGLTSRRLGEACAYLRDIQMKYS